MRISARLPNGTTSNIRSPLVDALIACIEATYRGLTTVVVGQGSRENPSVSDFLTYILAYPPGIPTPKISAFGPFTSLDPNSGHALDGRDVVLASGGIDSTAALLHLLDQGHHPIAIWCNYGQPYAVPEQSAVKEVCAALEVDLITIEVDLGAFLAGDENFGHVIPARNLLISACAAALGAAHITLAGLADELVVPDKSLRMYHEAQDHLGVPVQSPFVRMTKTDVLRVWDQRWRSKLDALMTVSCYCSDGDCQDCPACAKRAVAMVASGYAVRLFPVFENQQQLFLGSWLPRLHAFPAVRRADLLIALQSIRSELPLGLKTALDAVSPALLCEADDRREQLLSRRTVG